MKNILCSLDECKQRGKNIEKMTFEELQHFSNKCAACGSWILKDVEILNITYNKIALKYAEKFNEQLILNCK